MGKKSRPMPIATSMPILSRVAGAGMVWEQEQGSLAAADGFPAITALNFLCSCG